MPLQPFVKAAYRAACEVAAVLKQQDFSTLVAEHQVGHGGDVSIEADILSESILVKHLSPFGAILSEESGYCSEGDDLIVIDPIDGSDNFKSKLPYYGISIALVRDGVTQCGIVCNLCNGDFFYRMQDQTLLANLFTSFDESSNVTCNDSASIGLFEKAPNYERLVEALKEEGLKFRAPGAVALSLSYAHYVKYVLFLGTMRDYDILAGLHLCNDLYSYRDDSCLIVSKDLETFKTLCRMLDIKDNI
jgi:myo-inositol-1(or 4)-monophosphatase